MAARGKPLPRGLCRLETRTRRDFGPKAAHRHRLGQAGREDLRSPQPASTAAGSRAPCATPATTPSTAMSRPAAASSRRSSTTAPSPARRRDHHLCANCCDEVATLARGARRISASARATGSSSTCRWCRRRSSPCWPAPASAPSIRWCSAASPPQELATRIDDAKPKVDPVRLLRHRGEPRRRLQAAARRGDRRSPPHKPEACLVLQRPQADAALSRAATTIGPRPSPRRAPTGAAADVRAGRRDRSALHPLHVGHDRAAQGRRARQRRPHGRAQMVDEEHLRRRAGRGVLGRVRRRLGRRPLLHRLRAAAARLHDDPLRGQAGRHARCRRVLAGHRRARRRRAVHRADRVPRDQEGGSGRRAAQQLRPVALPHAVPGRRAGRSRHGAMGRDGCSACR